MLCSGRSPAHRNEILKFQSRLRISIRCCRHQEQKVPVGRDTKVVPVVRYQRVAKRIKARSDRLATKIITSFWETQHAHQSGFGELGVDHFLRILLGLRRYAFTDPELTNWRAIVQ